VFASKSSVVSNDSPPSFSARSSACVSHVKFKPKSIFKILRDLDASTATGPDNIPATVLINCASELCGPLARLFQLSFDRGIVHAGWKTASVTPVFKKGCRMSADNYRPISLLPIISKVMERILNSFLVSHLETNNLLSERQFGFRKGHSTIHPLLLLTT